jgi:hypothetical protein
LIIFLIYLFSNKLKIIPIKSAITSYKLESLPGILDCQISSKMQKIKPKRRTKIFTELKILKFDLSPRVPQIAYSVK